MASFLKDELLEFIGYDLRSHATMLNQPYIHNTIEFDTLTWEQQIDLSRINHPGEYERMLDEIKREFSEEVMKSIHVEAKDLTSREFRFNRIIRFTLRVQKPK